MQHPAHRHKHQKEQHNTTNHPHNDTPTHGFSGLGRNFHPAVTKNNRVVASLIPTAMYLRKMLQKYNEGRE